MSNISNKPCETDDCDNWINNPEICKECMELMCEIDLSFEIKEKRRINYACLSCED